MAGIKRSAVTLFACNMAEGPSATSPIIPVPAELLRMNTGRSLKSALAPAVILNTARVSITTESAAAAIVITPSSTVLLPVPFNSKEGQSFKGVIVWFPLRL